MDKNVSIQEYSALVSEASKIYEEASRVATVTLSKEELVKILNVLYTATGLAGEAGEVCNKIKKILRDNNSIIDEDVKQKVLGELGGVAWYLTACAMEFGFSVEDVLNYNHQQIKDRLNRGVIKGDGDNR